MQKKKIINFRPVFLAFISMVFALLISKRFLLGQAPYLLLFALVIAFIIGFSIIRRSFIPTIIAICFICLGIGSYLISVNQFNNAQDFNQPQQITAQVINVRNYKSSQSVILSKVKTNKNESFNINVYILGGDLQLGQQITFSAQLEKSNLFNLGEFSSYIYNNKIYYTAEIAETDIIEKTQKPLLLRDKIKNKTLEIFLNTMPQDSAYVAYGAMFGDTEKIDKEIYTSFANSGIIHLLSVSGMHIAFVVAILNFFISKTKLNKKLRFEIFAFALLFYSYLCSFNSTVIRSSLMSLALIFGTSFGKRYDMLTAIGLSGIILLLFSPLSAFDIGFQLSYLSVFMIAAFAKPLSQFFQRIHIPKALATPLAISVSVQAGLIPLTLKYFGQFPLISILSNLLIVPIFEIAFIFAFTMNIIAIIIPFLSFLLIPATFFINPVIKLSNFFSSLDWSMIYAKPDNSIYIIFFLIAIFIISGFVMLKLKYKAIILNVILILSLLFVGLESLPTKYNNLTVFQAHYLNTHSTIFHTQNEFLLITDLKDISYINKFASTANINDFDAVLLVKNYQQKNLNAFKNIYSNSVYIESGEVFDGNVFNISYITIYNDIKLPVIQAHGYKNLILTEKLSAAQHTQLNYATKTADINTYITWHNQQPSNDYDFLVFTNSLCTPNMQTKQINNWFFELKHGTINFVRSLN